MGCMANAFDWLDKATASSGQTVETLDLAVEVAGSPFASSDQTEAAKRVVNSARAVLRQRLPSEAVLQTLQIRRAALVEKLKPEQRPLCP